MMFKRSLFLLLLFAAPSCLSAQAEKKNVFSVSLGIWDQDEDYYGTPNHRFGITGGLEYHRILNDYFSIRGEFFTGVMSRNKSSINQSVRMFGVSAGIMPTPIGRHFSNFQIGVSPGVFMG